jgi:RNA polymerase sigma-70 factor (ECF subfamily)
MKPEASPLSTDELLDHTAWIRALAQGLVRDRSAVEDLVQETWLAFLRRRPSSEESIRPWLARVLRNQAALRLRRIRNGEDRERDAAPSNELPSALELVERAETQRRLVDAVVELEEPYRRTVLLRYYEGLSAVEIARRRAIPAATVRTHLKRGLDKLREKFDAETEGERRAWVGALLPLAGSRPPKALRFDAIGRAVVRDTLRWAAGGLVAAAATVVGVTLVMEESKPGGTHAAVSTAPAGPQPVPPATLAGGASDTARTPAGSPTPTGPLLAPSVRIVHAQDSTPLPGYLVRFHGPQGQELEYESDASGRITLQKGLPPGTWDVDLIDHPGLRRREIDHHGAKPPSESPLPPRTAQVSLAPGESTLRVDSGPGYALQLDVPPTLDPATLYTHLRADRPPTFRHDHWSKELAPLRAEFAEPDESWVRFGPLNEHFTKQGSAAMLEVFTQDGLYWGEAPVETILGVQQAPVAVTVEPRACLHGAVKDEYGSATVLDLILIREDGTRLLPENPDPEGDYRIPWLEPGSYTVRVESERHQVSEFQVELGGGEDRLLDFYLQRHTLAGEVSGQLRSASGMYSERVLIMLVPVDPTEGKQRKFTWPDWVEDNGEMVGAFSFEDVPQGEYDLQILSLKDIFPWGPSTLRVTPPATGLELVCGDQLPALDWGVEVFDGVTSKPLGKVVITCRTADGMERSFHRDPDADMDEWKLVTGDMVWTQVDGDFPLRSLPHGTQFEWAAFAEGYAPVYGDQDDFVGTMEGQVAKAQLSPGWGARVRIVDPEGVPVANATVSFDGQVMTNLIPGSFTLQTSSKPTALQIEAPGYEFFKGPYRPETQSLIGHRVWYEICLRPE